MRFSHAVIVPLIVASALFMEMMDGSIIATALPMISRSLNADPLHLSLAITSYMFSLAVFIPLSGWIADRHGARNVFCWAIVVFTIGSIACAMAQNLPQMVAARILQGAGGAMMVPVGRLILLRSVPKAQLVDAMAWFTAPAMIGPVIGPPIGGLIVTYASWRWIFFVNIPIGILGYFMARRFIDDIRSETVDPLDFSGFIMVACALTGLMAAFETVGRTMVAPSVTFAFFIFGLCAAALYLWHIKRTSFPIIDFSLLKYPTFRASLTGGSLFRMGIGATPFLLPLMLQYGFEQSPAMSGFITISGAIGALLMKIVAKPVLKEIGFRSVLLFNAVVNALMLAGIGCFTPQNSMGILFNFLLLGGVFRSLQFTALNTIAFADVPDEKMSSANTFYNMMQQLTLSTGVAVGALALKLTQYSQGNEALTAETFQPAFYFIGLLSLFSLIAYLPLRRDAGDEISGHKLEGGIGDRGSGVGD